MNLFSLRHQKEQSVRKASAKRAATPLLTPLSSLAFLFLATGLLSGCDTVARINFQNTQLNEISAPTNSFLMCGNPENGEFLTRMLLLDTQRVGVKKGDDIDGNAFTLKRNDVQINQMHISLFGTDKCNSQGGSSCSVDNFSCSAIQNLGYLQTCNIQAQSSTITDPEFVAAKSKTRTLALLIEKTPSLDGAIYNNTSQTLGASNRKTNQGLGTFVSALKTTFFSVQSHLEERDTNITTQFGLYSFDNNPIPKYYAPEPESGQNYTFLTTKKDINDANRSYSIAQSKPNTGAKVFDSIENIINPTSGSLYPTFDPSNDNILVVFVDGPDDYRTDPEKAINAAKAKNIKVFIVHVDPPATNANASSSQYADLYPDNPDYMTKECTTDEECATFESCRSYRKVSGFEYKNVTETNKYCLIDRTSTTNQTGPIDSYAKIACETGGGYLYFPSTLQNRSRSYNPLPWALEGLWEVKTKSSQLQSLPRGRYNLYGQFEINSDKRKIKYDYNETKSSDNRAHLIVTK